MSNQNNEKLIIGPWKVVHHKMPNEVKEALHKIKNYLGKTNNRTLLGLFNKFYIELFFEDGASIETTKEFSRQLKKNNDLNNDGEILALISDIKTFLKLNKNNTTNKFTYKNSISEKISSLITKEIKDAIYVGKSINPFIKYIKEKKDCSIIVLY